MVLLVQGGTVTHKVRHQGRRVHGLREVTHCISWSNSTWETTPSTDMETQNLKARILRRRRRASWASPHSFVHSSYNLSIFLQKRLIRRRGASWASPHLLSCPWFLPPGHLRPRFLVVTILFYPLSLCCPLVILNKEYSWSSSDGTQRPSRESERQFEAKVEDFFRSTIFSINQLPILKENIN